MGACFDGVTIRAKDDREAVAKCIQAIKDSRWDNGHGGYSGTLAEADGSVIVNKTFDDTSSAWEYLEDTAEKWGPAIGVKVKGETEGDTLYVFGAWCSS